MMNVVEHVAEVMDLNDMPYAFGARYAQEKGCLPGTRESFLTEICDVLNNVDEGASQVCLLTGVAGSGKSSVAHSIARLYDGQQRLGSSYCFARSNVASRNPENLFSTIARDLADHDPEYKSALWGIVKENRALRTSTSPFEQLERLIIEPSQNFHAVGPLVIVIDAVDESGDEDSRQQLLHAISKQIANNNLPTNLRFLITARPESDILAALPPCAQIVRKQMGDILEHVVDRDIHTFIRHSLHQYTQLEFSWPHEEWCQLLVRHSQHLFQWASTACRFIRGFGAKGLDPCKRLEILLHIDNEDDVYPLDDLYRTILQQLFTLKSAQRRFRDVMAVVLVLKEPLPFPSLSTLFDGYLNIQDIISVLGSLLDGVLDEWKPLRPVHTSFRDFLLDEGRSLAFHVGTLPGDSPGLSRALLACMRKMLIFNICNLKDSRLRNIDIPTLPSQVNKAIPAHLSYSCQYWMYHLQHAECSPALLDEVTAFFKDFFPYWLEAISLLSLSSPLSAILSALETCTVLKEWAEGQEIASLASEAFQFIQVFAPVLRESTPHLYLSAMPQIPSNSSLYKLWIQHLQKHVSATSGHPATWPAEVHTLQEHTDLVTSVAYSADGGHIVSGSVDGTIRIWNTATGQCVAGPIEGHTYLVWCVAYSPDGRHIVSGSFDKTIKVWNVTTGQCVAGPFEGHTSSVTSIAYSPDGRHIVSGSHDKTIRIWNVTIGQSVADPFEGHTDPVFSVAYSPDGCCVVSGSSDKTIRVWNSTTGHCVAGPFEGHTNFVRSVAYSPDGRHIVSGSWDKTIRIWNATTGHCMAGPFKGHADPVTSVAYSPDGRHIVSGSDDKTIRVWNATTGQCVAGPFEGHTGSGLSVAYSPDGRHIVSGSHDKTIRIWNVTIDQSMADPFEGPGNVISVAYSPDGKHIVSGSENKTIRVWSATTGQCVAGPFEEHTDHVLSVAYSPNGRHIVSGSSDETIRIWNANTGQCVAGPLEGHIGSVLSVAYSPNGRHIVSGSSDETIRIWNATTGQCVTGPLEGHTGYIFSVAYSPNGRHIVSGSSDKTIRVWNSTTGQCVVGPFEGHMNFIRSVAYSPNGRHIVSGSYDKTIRVWNATTGQCVAGPFEGHTNFVRSIAYLPDG
ncbi:WD40 repeat-like protein, partial [Boletus edulis]